MSKNLKIFTDFHHAGLLHSLILLFEDRLGGEVYRPIGREWYNEGYWHVFNHPDTVGQYLDIGGATPDGTPKLNEVESVTGETLSVAQYYNCYDIDSGFTNKAITYDGFLNLDFDIVIASIPDHIEPFKKLTMIHPNRPKLIFQIGNAWTTGAGQADNIMASAVIHNVPENINFVSYHQEFDLQTFYPQFNDPDKNIYTFVNAFNNMDHYKNDWALFQQIENLMPDYSFKSFGGQCRDGVKNGADQVADAMRSARWIWHTKAGGDGYGHIVHNAPAVGRPLIVKKDYYRGKMAEPLLIDGVTCITIDGLSPEQIVKKIEHFNVDHRYKRLQRQAYKRFTEIVDFDKEEKEIRKFLDQLI